MMRRTLLALALFAAAAAGQTGQPIGWILEAKGDCWWRKAGDPAVRRVDPEALREKGAETVYRDHEFKCDAGGEILLKLYSEKAPGDDARADLEPVKITARDWARAPRSVKSSLTAKQKRLMEARLRPCGQHQGGTGLISPSDGSVQRASGIVVKVPAGAPPERFDLAGLSGAEPVAVASAPASRPEEITLALRRSLAVPDRVGSQFRLSVLRSGGAAPLVSTFQILAAAEDAKVTAELAAIAGHRVDDELLRAAVVMERNLADEYLAFFVRAARTALADGSDAGLVRRAVIASRAAGDLETAAELERGAAGSRPETRRSR